MKSFSPAQGATALACAALALSIGGLVALNTGLGFGLPPLGFGLALGYDDAAYRRTSHRPSKADLLAAAALSRRAVRIAPYQSAARMRLALIDTLLNGRLTKQGQAELARSYDLVPIDPDIAGWRIRFSLEHWESLPAETRQDVYEEAKTFTEVHSAGLDVPHLLSSVRNPSGSLAGALWMRSWTREHAQAPIKATKP